MAATVYSTADSPTGSESCQLHSATWGIGDQLIEIVQYLDVENYIFLLGRLISSLQEIGLQPRQTMTLGLEIFSSLVNIALRTTDTRLLSGRC